MADLAEKAEQRMPTRPASILFWMKASLLQLRRGLQDIGAGICRYPQEENEAFPYVCAEVRTPLWSEARESERLLQLGKAQNLRVALRRLHGATIPAGGVFSFWKQMGRATRGRGYVAGRQLREGCLFPAIGGGLCQLSNALYELALQTDCEIVERHAHSHVVPNSAAAVGRDAAVAWNYIDLRFRPRQEFHLEARLTADELILRARSRQPKPRPLVSPIAFLPLPTRTERAQSDTRPVLDAAAHSCATCGIEACFRHKAVNSSRSQIAAHRAAYLVDELWPEFQAYLDEAHSENDVLGISLNGVRWNQPRYAWNTTGYARIGTASWQTLWRSFRSRRLGKYGAKRLQAQLACAEVLAKRLAHELTPDIETVCVAQSLLPFLWREGSLGGRQFEVLMTRLPMQTLHSRLDAAFALHPDRTTLGEFRAPDWLVRVEAEALANADRILTPHAEIASLFPGKAGLLDWQLPQRMPAPRGKAIAFPGPTVARKGAYELRAVARKLDLEIVLLGSELEGEDFWQGARVRRVTRNSSADWLEGVGVVVQSALVEDRPRSLLAAIAAGVPVIATSACGLGDLPDVTTVPFGDENALETAIRRVLERSA